MTRHERVGEIPSDRHLRLLLNNVNRLPRIDTHEIELLLQGPLGRLSQDRQSLRRYSASLGTGGAS